MSTFHKASLSGLRVFQVSENGEQIMEGSGLSLLQLSEHSAWLDKCLLGPFKVPAYHRLGATSALLPWINEDFGSDQPHEWLKSTALNGIWIIATYSELGSDDNDSPALGLYFFEEQAHVWARLNEEGQLINGFLLDKPLRACLIFKIEEREGYKVQLYDRLPRSPEGEFWKSEILKAEPRQDPFHQTAQFMEVTRSFVKEEFPQQFEADKTDQADFMNRTLAYMKAHETLSPDDFAREVFRQPEVTEAFERFAQQKQMNIKDEFTISDHAVRKEQRVYKSVLKLDKNFHIYIHGDRQLIKKGYDEEKGLHFYQVYFKEEQ
jgi:hypothetical protein